MLVSATLVATTLVLLSRDSFVRVADILGEWIARGWDGLRTSFTEWNESRTAARASSADRVRAASSTAKKTKISEPARSILDDEIEEEFEEEDLFEPEEETVYEDEVPEPPPAPVLKKPAPMRPAPAPVQQALPMDGGSAGYQLPSLDLLREARTAEHRERTGAPGEGATDH